MEGAWIRDMVADGKYVREETGSGQTFEVPRAEVILFRVVVLVAALVGIACVAIGSGWRRHSAENAWLVGAGLGVVAFGIALGLLPKALAHRRYRVELTEGGVCSGHGPRHAWGAVARVRVNGLVDRVELIDEERKVLAFLDYRLSRFSEAFEFVASRCGAPSDRTAFDYRRSALTRVLVPGICGIISVIALAAGRAEAIRRAPHPLAAGAILLAPATLVVTAALFSHRHSLRAVQLGSTEFVVDFGGRLVRHAYARIARIRLIARYTELLLALETTSGQTILLRVPTRDILEMYSALKAYGEPPKKAPATSSLRV